MNFDGSFQLQNNSVSCKNTLSSQWFFLTDPSVFPEEVNAIFMYRVRWEWGHMQVKGNIIRRSNRSGLV